MRPLHGGQRQLTAPKILMTKPRVLYVACNSVCLANSGSSAPSVRSGFMGPVPRKRSAGLHMWLLSPDVVLNDKPIQVPVLSFRVGSLIIFVCQ